MSAIIFPIHQPLAYSRLTPKSYPKLQRPYLSQSQPTLIHSNNFLRLKSQKEKLMTYLSHTTDQILKWRSAKWIGFLSSCNIRWKNCLGFAYGMWACMLILFYRVIQRYTHTHTCRAFRCSAHGTSKHRQNSQEPVILSKTACVFVALNRPIVRNTQVMGRFNTRHIHVVSLKVTNSC